MSADTGEAPLAGWRAPPLPRRETLEGRLVRLEPLLAERHGAALYAAFEADPDRHRLNWTYRLQHPPASEAAFLDWLAMREIDPAFRYAIYVCRRTGTAFGMGAFMTMAPAAGTLEVGSFMIAPDWQGTAAATEAMSLQIARAFSLGYRRCEWTADPLNTRSMRAAERLGFSFEALHVDAYVTKGRNRDKAVFAIRDTDWPAIAEAHRIWLAPENFDAGGRQRTRLSTLTAPLLAARAPAAEVFGAPDRDADGQAIGRSLTGWQAPPHPVRATIRGRSVTLSPLTVDHAPALHAANALSTDGAIWRWLPYGPFGDETAYACWVGTVTLDRDPLFFALTVDGRPLGVASYLRIAPEHGSIEIGHICLSPALQRTRAATEALTLMMRHAFDLGYRRCEWKCDALNRPSRRAAIRLGFSFEGITRQAGIVKGRNRDTAWFAVTGERWPALRRAFDLWLDPDNFDGDGRQRQALHALTRPLVPIVDPEEDSAP